jgi:hypothetical protein
LPKSVKALIYNLKLSPGDVGTRQTVAALRALINRGREDMKVRRLAEAILKRYPPHYSSPRQMIAAIFDWVSANVRYVRDPVQVELVRGAGQFMDSPAGDCDDYTVLLGSLIESIGIPVGIKVVQTGRRRRFNHVYPIVNIGGQELALDATQGRPIGYEPAIKRSETYMELNPMNSLRTPYDEIRGLGYRPPAYVPKGVVVPKGTFRLNEVPNDAKLSQYGVNKRTWQAPTTRPVSENVVLRLQVISVYPSPVSANMDEVIFAWRWVSAGTVPGEPIRPPEPYHPPTDIDIEEPPPTNGQPPVKPYHPPPSGNGNGTEITSCVTGPGQLVFPLGTFKVGQLLNVAYGIKFAATNPRGKTDAMLPSDKRWALYISDEKKCSPTQAVYTATYKMVDVVPIAPPVPYIPPAAVITEEPTNGEVPVTVKVETPDWETVFAKLLEKIPSKADTVSPAQVVTVPAGFPEIPTWVYIAGAALVGYLLFKKK